MKIHWPSVLAMILACLAVLGVLAWFFYSIPA